MPNRFTPVPGGTDPAQQAAAINKNFAELDQESVKKLYYGSDGLPSIFIDGSVPVIKVAPAGTDVTTADDDELNFNSAQNVFKVLQSGTTALTAVAGSGVATTVEHNLGRVPALLAYANSPFDGPNAYTPLNYSHWSSTTLYVFAEVKTRLNDIYFNIDVGPDAAAWAGLWTIKYYIFVESAA